MGTESKRIAGLFSDWYHDDPWTFVRMKDILEDISAEQAAKKPIKTANSIWQIVQHCISWRENVLQKMQGANFTSPEDNYLSPPTDTSEEAWQDLLMRLEENEIQWQEFLDALDDDQLDTPYAPAKDQYTWYEVIHGLLHHDNYHFGQIVMLKKLL